MKLIKSKEKIAIYVIALLGNIFTPLGLYVEGIPYNVYCLYIFCIFGWTIPMIWIAKEL